MKRKSFCAQLQALMNPISTTIIVICSMKNKFRVTTNVVAATITKLITLGCANDLIRKVLIRANSEISGNLEAKLKRVKWEEKDREPNNKVILPMCIYVDVFLEQRTQHNEFPMLFALQNCSALYAAATNSMCMYVWIFFFRCCEASYQHKSASNEEMKWKRKRVRANSLYRERMNESWTVCRFI